MATKRVRSKVSPGGTAAPGGYLIGAQVGFLMRVAMQRHTAIFMGRMIEELTPAQFAVMAKLYEVGPYSQNHLGRLVYLDAATIKGVVDRLGLRGFIATDSDPSDRRRRAVSLTPQGTRVVEAAIKVAAGITEETLVPLTADERRVLLKLLKKLT